MRKFVYLIAVTLFISSCGVKYKSIPYFTDLPQDSVTQEQIKNHFVLKLQKNDILAITVNSLNPEASAIFNLGSTSSNQAVGGGSSDPTLTANGFLVDEKGSIQLPLIGSITVAGLTTAQARVEIENKLLKYLKEPVVSLRLINFRISVLGDVTKPGVYSVVNERISLSEALSMAGDLTITGVRNNVLLIREQNGVREYVRLDLGKKDLINSSYYYLQNNDVLYIQPGSAKYASVDSSYRNVSILLTALSVLTLIITRL